MLPTAAWIDSVSAHHPVWVCRMDGHMCLANSLAMRLAHIDVNTKVMCTCNSMRVRGMSVCVCVCVCVCVQNGRAHVLGKLTCYAFGTH